LRIFALLRDRPTKSRVHSIKLASFVLDGSPSFATMQIADVDWIADDRSDREAR
jgi:hypothetical protein